MYTCTRTDTNPMNKPSLEIIALKIKRIEINKSAFTAQIALHQ